MSIPKKYSDYLNDEIVTGEKNTLDELAQKLGLKLAESEKTKIFDSAKKLVDVFNGDLSDFKMTIDDATYEDIDCLGEFNIAKHVVIASSEIKAKVLTSTNTLDKKMKIITNGDFKRNLFDIVLQKSLENKTREILVGFMEYVKQKQDEFNLFSQEIASNISNLKRENEVVTENTRTLGKKAITLTLSSTFFKSILPHIDVSGTDHQEKLIALDRRLRTMYEILYVAQKNVIDIDNQVDMFNELQNIVDEYKVSAMRIVSMEIKNRIVLQDIKEMYESLNNVRETINKMISDNTKITEGLVQDIHNLSKYSILDYEVITNAVESATDIKDTQAQRKVDIHKQIVQDNREYLDKVNKMVKNSERWNERQNAKSMLDAVAPKMRT